MYAIFDEKYSRATTDIDLLGSGITNSTENFKNIISDMYSIETEDPIQFDLHSLQIKKITEFKEYSGINVSIMGYLDKTRCKISIDIGFGDIVYPAIVRMCFLALIDDNQVLLNAYSIETVIAEKMEAIVSLGLLNSRLKDFYDIYAISKSFDLEGLNLQQAMIETFHHRHTAFGEIYAFTDVFITPYRKTQWKSFLKKKNPNEKLELNEVIGQIKIFITPILKSILNDEDFHFKWSYKDNYWKIS